MNRTRGFERDNGLFNVIVDEPQGIPNTIPPVWEVTSPALAIVRLHGRNREAWNGKALTACSQRFNYDYGEAGLAERVETLSRQARAVHVLFSTNYQDRNGPPGVDGFALRGSGAGTRHSVSTFGRHTPQQQIAETAAGYWPLSTRFPAHYWNDRDVAHVTRRAAMDRANASASLVCDIR